MVVEQAFVSVINSTLEKVDVCILTDKLMIWSNIKTAGMWRSKTKYWKVEWTLKEWKNLVSKISNKSNEKFLSSRHFYLFSVIYYYHWLPHCNKGSLWIPWHWCISFDPPLAHIPQDPCLTPPIVLLQLSWCKLDNPELSTFRAHCQHSWNTNYNFIIDLFWEEFFAMLKQKCFNVSWNNTRTNFKLITMSLMT